MVWRCWVPNCLTGTSAPNGGTHGSELTRFKAPSNNEERLKWQKAIPRDKAVLQQHHRVCELHFQPEDIVRKKIINYGTWIEEVDIYPPQLVKGAVPSIWPGCPKYLTRESNKRKPPVDRSNVLPIKKKRKITTDATAFDQSVDKGSETSTTTSNEMVLINSNEVSNARVLLTENRANKRKEPVEHGPSKKRRECSSEEDNQLLHIDHQEPAGVRVHSEPIVPVPFRSPESVERNIRLEVQSVQEPPKCLFASYPGVHLPADWFIKPLNNVSFSAFTVRLVTSRSHVLGAPTIEKSLSVDLKERKIEFYVSSKLLPRAPNPVQFNNINDLNDLIRNFDKDQLCPAIRKPKYSSVKNVALGEQNEGVWRSHQCQLLRDNGQVCCQCFRLERSLVKKLWQQSKEATANKKPFRVSRNYRSLSHNDKNLLISRLSLGKLGDKRKIVKLKAEVGELKLKVVSLKEECSKIQQAKVDQILDKIKNRQARLTVSTIIKRSKFKNSKSMRYEADWLLECLLLRIKSFSVYEHLRKKELLPLPCPNTLRDMLGAMSNNFGFSETALEAIEKLLDGKNLEEKVGVLSMDEMKVTETFDFDRQSLNFHGFIHLDPDASSSMFICPTEEEEEEEDSSNPRFDGPKSIKDLADHALVFMFRTLFGPYVQPFGMFASRGAASGENLVKLLLAAVIRLHARGARVLNVVCDGCQTNKQMWSLLGVGIKFMNGKEIVTSSITHPTDPNWRIYFTLDPPHGIKTVRNQIFNKRIVQVGGEVMSKVHIERLHAADSNRLGGLKVCPRLSPAHINPTSFQRMNVKLAVQVLSHSVAVGLRTYREDEFLNDIAPEKCLFAHTHTMESTIEIVDQSFDVMNARIPKNGINLQKWAAAKLTLRRLDSVLKRTADYDNANHGFDVTTPPFVSATTNLGLRITINSFIEMINYLLNDLKFKYVLTGKMNQDCLERFFGIIRTAGGGNEKPTVSSFTQLCNMLSLYYPTKMMLNSVKGSNVDSADALQLVTPFRDWMSAKSKLKFDQCKAFKSDVKDILLQGIKVILREDQEEERSLQITNASMNEKIIYYICGFLVRKYVSKSRCCVDCAESITSAFGALPENFTAQHLVMNKNKGGLKFASTPLFKLICVAEGTFLDYLREGKIFKPNSFPKMLYNICYNELPLVGCQSHHITVMPNLIYDYLLSRFTCLGKQKRQELCSKSRAEKHSNMKKSKL